MLKLLKLQKFQTQKKLFFHVTGKGYVTGNRYPMATVHLK